MCLRKETQLNGMLYRVGAGQRLGSASASGAKVGGGGLCQQYVRRVQRAQILVLIRYIHYLAICWTKARRNHKNMSNEVQGYDLNDFGAQLEHSPNHDCFCSLNCVDTGSASRTRILRCSETWPDLFNYVH